MRVPQGWAQARFTLFVTLATVAAYVVVAAIGWTEGATIWGGFIPARLAYGGDEMLAPFWITPLTATFLHANLLHLFFNLLILVYCGRPTEAVVGTPGAVILYVLGAYAAAAAQYAAGPTSPVPMIGASGAISAVLGAYAILFGRNKVKVASPRLAMLLNTLWLMAAWVVLQIIVGVTFANAGIQVAIAAHVGGFAVGLVLANPLLLFRYRKA